MSLCVNKLRRRLKVADVIEVLIYANLYNFLELKTACLRFIRAHSREVKGTSGWSLLKENAEMYSSVLAEIMEVLA